MNRLLSKVSKSIFSVKCPKFYVLAENSNSRCIQQYSKRQRRHPIDGSPVMPSLKEVDAVAAGPVAAAGTESANHPMITVTSSDDNNDARAYPTAAAFTGQIVAPTISIQPENPDDIPPDESAFTLPPHFRQSNPFHRNMRDLDLSMRCAICSDLYHAPVTLLPCLHNFCSLCIRNHFKATYTG